jgi:hypothetical protein
LKKKSKNSFYPPFYTRELPPFTPLLIALGVNGERSEVFYPFPAKKKDGEGENGRNGTKLLAIAKK